MPSENSLRLFNITNFSITSSSVINCFSCTIKKRLFVCTQLIEKYTMILWYSELGWFDPLCQQTGYIRSSTWAAIDITWHGCKLYRLEIIRSWLTDKMFEICFSIHANQSFPKAGKMNTSCRREVVVRFDFL